MSRTDNGKFFIVVFQRFQKIKPSARNFSEEFVNSSSFDDVAVKEMSQIEAIQLLKRFGNDLHAFVNEVVSFNRRFEKVDFGPLHKHLLEMGNLSTSQWQ